MAKVVLLTGTNLGNKTRNLESAQAGIASSVGTILRKSRVYESEPWGFESEECFLNQAFIVDTQLLPLEVLDRTQALEEALGRIRPLAPAQSPQGERIYESRLIDIDLLFYNDLILKSERLTIPHPLICQREFVLAPLREIMPGFIHPENGKRIDEL